MGILIRTMRELPCEDTARLAFCHLVGASNQNQSLLVDWSQTPNFGTVKKKNSIVYKSLTVSYCVIFNISHMGRSSKHTSNIKNKKFADGHVWTRLMK